MSFTPVPQRPARLNRSELAVPGSNRRFLEKAAADPQVDVVFLDLEDAVAIDKKAEARKNVIEAISDLDWGEKSVSVRINGMDTPYCYRDVIDILEQASDRLDLIMLPKVGRPEDVYAIDFLITQVESARGRAKRVGLELLIESAMGMMHIDAIAAASPRNESLHFGAADYAASTKADTVQIGGPNPRYAVLTDADEAGHRQVHWGDMWHYALNRLVIAARANGLRPIDGPFGDFSDEAGFTYHANRAMVLGCEGKWAIHPSQVPLCNTLFSPSQDELKKAYAVLDAMEQARAKGQGAAALDGKLIDLASIRQAEAMVAKHEAAGGTRVGAD
ncbi:MAG: HpcH/HpaI aldolase/citrate lyase family protein [Rhodothalassiaceae bacterium]